ncbi:MAG: hypothetical protein R3B95_09630 [Nitrospirales bacterium]|nr:hypothetical protein [Nitrospirales bacterium]
MFPPLKQKWLFPQFKGKQTVAELTQRFDRDPNPITQWTTLLLECGAGFFEGGGSPRPLWTGKRFFKNYWAHDDDRPQTSANSDQIDEGPGEKPRLPEFPAQAWL